MLVRGFPRLLIVLCPLLLVGWVVGWIFGHPRHAQQDAVSRIGLWLQQQGLDAVIDERTDMLADSKSIVHMPIPPPPVVDVDDDGRAVVDRSLHREIYSTSSATGDYIRIFFGGVPAYNPNIIPHPTKHDLWIVVARQEQSLEPAFHDIVELTCNAGFLNGVLTCAKTPVPVNLTLHEPHCEGDLEFHNFVLGGRDARIAYGPDAPYIVYGSHTEESCMGVWIQDLRVLLDAYVVESAIANLFREPAQLRRPAPQRAMDKNFFLFWDFDNKLYVQHDISPKRVFAQVELGGSVGPDLAPSAASTDEVCMARYMPAYDRAHEIVQQATNSLSITMCERVDPGCRPSAENTFIMHIVHFKSFYDWHPVYEPYVVLFQQQAPFALHAISKKALWIHGRDVLSEQTGSILWQGKTFPTQHSESFYMTSISWKTHGQRYHGYMDDELFISFGIEDSRPGVIDVVAGELLQDLGSCGDLFDKPPEPQTEIKA